MKLLKKFLLNCIMSQLPRIPENDELYRQERISEWNLDENDSDNCSRFDHCFYVFFYDSQWKIFQQKVHFHFTDFGYHQVTLANIVTFLRTHHFLINFHIRNVQNWSGITYRLTILPDEIDFDDIVFTSVCQ